MSSTPPAPTKRDPLGAAVRHAGCAELAPLLAQLSGGNGWGRLLRKAEACDPELDPSKCRTNGVAVKHLWAELRKLDDDADAQVLAGSGTTAGKEQAAAFAAVIKYLLQHESSLSAPTPDSGRVSSTLQRNEPRNEARYEQGTRNGGS